MKATTALKEKVPMRRVLAAIVCLYFVLLLMMGLFRNWGNMSSLNDLGLFDQAVWGTLHGQWFLDTNNAFGRPINWLSCHFNLFLLLFVPLYALSPATEWFAIAQAFALSVAAWPVFLLAKSVHNSEKIGMLWAVIYLLNPFLLSAGAWDFHPVTIAVPFIAGALLAVERKEFRLLMICCFCLLLIQEQLGLTTAGLGALWGLKHRDWKRGLFVICVGGLHTVLVPGIIMPALSPSGTHSMIVDPAGQDSRYGWLGSTFSEVIGNIVFHPFVMLRRVFSTHAASRYFSFLGFPFLGLFLAAPLWLLPAIADLAANTLSANHMPRSVMSYHSVTLVPILTASAIYGVRRIALLFANRMAAAFMTTLSLILTVASCYIVAPLPLPGALNLWKPVQWAKTPDPYLKRVHAVIPEHASLAVQANIGPHFTQRQLVFRYPCKLVQPDTIVLWLDSPTYNILPHNRYAIGTIAHHLQMDPAEYLASVECLLDNPDYAVNLWIEPWLVVSRSSKTRVSDEPVRNKLVSLRHTWKITAEAYATALQKVKTEQP
ncbi:DUF2079 domain-containing protein [Geomonas azotofigens]|uniref:DUF2079 domain-containing protein n=1 Tax=Geomonas azotofigens TaxID=2843196 RepID=UPI001C11D624|nr:DUF2079 domain-containing protein [Geomonas azotofigens]MBU5612490.1 DUF2079 domain-containing protein [Geomonas azotofigens]